MQVSPGDPEAWSTRSILLNLIGNLTGAIAAADRVLELKPDSHRTYNRKGLMLQKMNRSGFRILQGHRVGKIQTRSISAELTQYFFNTLEVLKPIDTLAEAEDNLKIYGISKSRQPGICDLGRFDDSVTGEVTVWHCG